LRRHIVVKISPLFPPGQRPYGPAAKEGEFLPFVKGGEEGFGLQRPYNYGPINNSGSKDFGISFELWI